MKKNNFSQKGFTLVELMVTIAIMALLTGIITANFASSRKKARDTKRISDLGQIQLALELVFDRCNAYPAVSNGTVSTNVVCTTSSGAAISINTFLNPVPTPPSNSTVPVYSYAINGLATDYVLQVPLEVYSEVLKDDFDGQIYGINCGTAANGQGTAETFYCLTPQ